jgi:hypothetical protein
MSASGKQASEFLLLLLPAILVSPVEHDGIDSSDMASEPEEPPVILACACWRSSISRSFGLLPRRSRI